MAVRNSRPRTQTNYIFANYNNQRYMIQVGAFNVKQRVYYIKEKLLKIIIILIFYENSFQKIISL